MSAPLRPDLPGTAARDRYRGAPAWRDGQVVVRLARGRAATLVALLWAFLALALLGWAALVLAGLDVTYIGRYDARYVAGGAALAALYGLVRSLLDRGCVRSEGRYLLATRAPLPPRAELRIPVRELIQLRAREVAPGPIDRLRAGGRESFVMPWTVEARLRDGTTGSLPLRLTRVEAERLATDLVAVAQRLYRAQAEARPWMEDWL